MKKFVRLLRVLMKRGKMSISTISIFKKQYNFPNNTEIIDIEKIIEQIKGNLPNQGIILND